MASNSESASPIPRSSTSPGVEGGASAEAGCATAGAVRDKACAAAVVVFAFLLASFPARNSEVWLHLGTGRALAQGTTSLVSPPMLHTAEDHFWINRAWLYDVACYGVYQALGATGLLIAKALLIALLAALLLRLGGGGWSTALLVALALLALSPRLDLQPVCLSYLFLALTMLALQRFALPHQRQRQLAGIGLLALFVLWVNVDDWFLLGPLVVLLTWLGTLMDQRNATVSSAAGLRKADVRAWTTLSAAGLLVGLVNPYHWHALALPEALTAPPEWSRLEDAMSPLWSPASLAYYLLILLGLVSFVVNRSAWRWSRALVWITFCVLSVYDRAALPFFAIAGGVIAAQNLKEFARGLRRPVFATEGRPWWAMGVAWLPATVLAAAVLTAWPGWLQGSFEPRQWTIQGDASLEQAARQVAQWRADGSLPAAARGFNLSPALAHYCAWFAPEEKSFFTGRSRDAPAAVASEFLAVRQALTEAPAASSHTDDWRAILRGHRITHVLVHDRTARRFTAALRRLFAAPQEWRLVYLRGGTTVFVWRDLPEAPAVRLPAVDLKRRAYEPSAAEQAPTTEPPRDAEARAWWTAFWKPRAAADPDRDETLVYLAHFEAQAQAYSQATQVVWENGMSASVVGLAAPPTTCSTLVGESLGAMLLHASRGHVPAAATGQHSLPEQPSLPDWLAAQFIPQYLFQRDDGPPESLFLAVRAARRALFANPHDPLSHLYLGHAYVHLARWTRERATQTGFLSLHQMRKVQAVTAFKGALLLKPDLVRAHEQLASLYLEFDALDLALEHMQEQLRHGRTAGPRPGESADLFRERLDSLDDRVQQLGKRVREALNLFELQSSNADVYGRARAAQSNGLPKKALEILLRSTYPAFGREGALLELQLLLYTGRVSEVRDWMEPEHERILGPIAYRTLHSQWAAATGNYAEADGDLASLTVADVDQPELKLQQPLRELIALQLAGWLLEQAGPHKMLALPRPADGRLVLPDERSALLERLKGATVGLRQQAELWALRGMLALESGATQQAQASFRQSLAWWSSSHAGPAWLIRRYADRP